MTTYAHKSRRNNYRRTGVVEKFGEVFSFKNKRKENNSFMVWNKMRFISILAVMFVAVFFSGMLTGKILTITSGDYMSVNSHTRIVAELNSQIRELNSTVAKLGATISTQKKEIDSLQNVINDTDSLVDMIVDKYDYVWKYKADSATMSFSHLLKLDQVAKETNVNPHIMLAMYSIESNWNSQAANKVSTARGYGQILRSTGNAVWTKIMKKSNYDHSYALNPLTNIEMTTRYLAYKVNNEGNLIDSIRGYNGEFSTDKYYNWVKDKMTLFGTSGTITTPGYIE